ncbi:MAG: leucine-rich repeat protein [Firmicutes bacterium]|nr:leucine-rich repeat protein [Bacillota bacterium]
MQKNITKYAVHTVAALLGAVLLTFAPAVVDKANVLGIGAETVCAETSEPVKCGENVTYTFDTDTGVLTISGTGDMADYNILESPLVSSSIKSVIIENGVTSIGNYAFYYLLEESNLTSVTIPDSVTSIRNTLEYEGNFTSYQFNGDGTFYNHNGEVVYTGSFKAGAPTDRDTFIAAVKDINYDDYAADIETYRADPVKFTGKIIQLWDEDGSGVDNYVISLDDSDEQLIFIYDYRPRLGIDTELHENDIITGYGLTTAAYTYDSKSGESVTSPAVFTFFTD